MTAPPPGLENQARQLMGQGKLAEAEALIRPYLASGSGPIPLWRALAQAIRAQGRIAEARAIQEMLVEAVPGDLPGRFDLAESALLLGDFARGWREYHWRYSLDHTTRIDRKVQRPSWDGRRIEGKTLLIHDEQGYGDSLQFMRLVSLARQRSGARVILEMNNDLMPLAARLEGFDTLLPRGTIPPPFDVHAQMMSLPMILGLKLTDLPGKIPYLSADPGRVAFWRRRLENLPRPLAATVWAGRPTHHNDANRSLRLADFAPLGGRGVTFVAVQKGPKAVEAGAPPPGLDIISLSDEIRDFEDTAAILTVADLLVSVDSSPIHLAGALGRPAWVLLPFVPDWRWLLDREDTPWYPGMRLFRQPAIGDWPSAIARLGDALESFRPGSGVSGRPGS